MTARFVALLCLGGAGLLALIPGRIGAAKPSHREAAGPGLCGVVVVGRVKPPPKPPGPTPTPAPVSTVVLLPTSPPISTPVPPLVVTLSAGDLPRGDASHTTGKYGPRPGIACVWTSADPRSRPADTFAHGSAVYLIAAWRVLPRADLPRDRLQLRWAIYHPYHRRLRFIPPRRDLVAYRRVFVPGRLQVGTYRLRFAPTVRVRRRGWYEVLARAVLYGPHCPRGCIGQARQTRFFMY